MSTNLAQLHHQVMFGQSGGKIIWQPRIGGWYYDKKFMGQPLGEPYTGMSYVELFRSLGCSARIYDYGDCFKRIEHPQVRHIWQDAGSGERIKPPQVPQSRHEVDTRKKQHIIETPAGTQVEIVRQSPNNQGTIHVKWEVASEEELKVATWREENTTWQWDQERYEAIRFEWGDMGAPTAYLPRMNVQSLYLNKMGIQAGIYAICDWPDTTEGYFRALEESHERLIDVVNACPIDIINFGENIHASTLSSELFVKYHLPTCQRRCERLHAADKFVHSHWDGDTKPLLAYAKQTGLDGIEAITPQPQGDVTLEEVKEALGDEMVLLDGIPAIYFDDMFPIEVLTDCAHKIIELFAPRLVLGISDEISSTGDIERIGVVGEIVDEYNARFDT